MALDRRMGEAVRAWREHRGLTGEDLARKAGLPDKSYVSKVETGNIKMPSDQSLTALAQALEIPVAYLLLRQTPDEVQRAERGTLTRTGAAYKSQIGADKEQVAAELISQLQEDLKLLDERLAMAHKRFERLKAILKS